MESRIRSTIENVVDADLSKNLGELDAIKSIKIDGKRVEIKIELVQPIYVAAKDVTEAVLQVLKAEFSDYTIEVIISEKPFAIPERNILPNVKNIIAVASGKGGVGKSSIAANLAAGLSKTGALVGILDGDVYGPSQPTMYGLANAKLEATQLPDGSVKAKPKDKFGVKVASMGFIMEPTQAAIVRGPMLAGYFSMLFEQIDWGALDFLVFDLPPGTGDIQLTLTQKIPLTGAVIVTTPQEISLADVRRSVAMFRKVNVDILGVVENMSYFVPPDMPDKKYYIFGEGGGQKIAEETGTKLLGQVPLDIAMREGNDGGVPVVIRDIDSPQSQKLMEVTSRVIAEVRRKNYEQQGAESLSIEI